MHDDATLEEVSLRTAIELLRYIARALAQDPDGVLVAATSDGLIVYFRLQVAPSDIGRIIGKAGRTAQSIRCILAAANTTKIYRYKLDIPYPRVGDAP